MPIGGSRTAGRWLARSCFSARSTQESGRRTSGCLGCNDGTLRGAQRHALNFQRSYEMHAFFTTRAAGGSGAAATLPQGARSRVGFAQASVV
eukprot:scaffold84739_cov69-Phaeocystis_antarctica.AAC.2